MKAQKQSLKPVALIPTMGALHGGHLALIAAAREKGCFVICTIYVNPAQFNNAEDLKNYPHSPDDDIELLESGGCDLLFFPEDHEMYPIPPTLQFSFGVIDSGMEGKFRPGHFNGVALIVSKLLYITEPSFAFFGQKDWQQCLIVKELCGQIFLNTEIIIVPTVREIGGLAMSSRNKRLSERARKRAELLFMTLQESQKLIREGMGFQIVKVKAVEAFRKEDGYELEYFEMAEPGNLKPIDFVDETGSAMLFIAAYVDGVRLIDNIFI